MGGVIDVAHQPFMKTVSKYLAMLAVMLTASNIVFAEPQQPVVLAQLIASFTDSGPTDPAPPAPGSDIVQRDAPPR
jgi:hypothetical protein